MSLLHILFVYVIAAIAAIIVGGKRETACIKRGPASARSIALRRKIEEGGQLERFRCGVGEGLHQDRTREAQRTARRGLKQEQKRSGGEATTTLEEHLRTGNGSHRDGTRHLEEGSEHRKISKEKDQARSRAKRGRRRNCLIRGLLLIAVLCCGEQLVRKHTQEGWASELEVNLQAKKTKRDRLVPREERELQQAILRTDWRESSIEKTADQGNTGKTGSRKEKGRETTRVRKTQGTERGRLAGRLQILRLRKKAR